MDIFPSFFVLFLEGLFSFRYGQGKEVSLGIGIIIRLRVLIKSSFFFLFFFQEFETERLSRPFINLI